MEYMDYQKMTPLEQSVYTVLNSCGLYEDSDKTKFKVLHIALSLILKNTQNYYPPEKSSLQHLAQAIIDNDLYPTKNVRPIYQHLTEAKKRLVLANSKLLHKIFEIPISDPFPKYSTYDFVIKLASYLRKN